MTPALRRGKGGGGGGLQSAACRSLIMAPDMQSRRPRLPYAYSCRTTLNAQAMCWPRTPLPSPTPDACGSHLSDSLTVCVSHLCHQTQPPTNRPQQPSRPLLLITETLQPLLFQHRISPTEYFKLMWEMEKKVALRKIWMDVVQLFKGVCNLWCPWCLYYCHHEADISSCCEETWLEMQRSMFVSNVSYGRVGHIQNRRLHRHHHHHLCPHATNSQSCDLTVI